MIPDLPVEELQSDLEMVFSETTAILISKAQMHQEHSLRNRTQSLPRQIQSLYGVLPTYEVGCIKETLCCEASNITPGIFSPLEGIILEGVIVERVIVEASNNLSITFHL